MYMTNEIQIVDLQPEIMVVNEKWLNLFVQKAEILRKSLDELWEVLNDETYETAKKLRQEITSWKTSVEDARSKIKAPVLELWRQIDSRAKFLSDPFEKMKEEVNQKIYSYEEEDRKRKEAEQKRIDDIISKVNSFNNLNELVEYYKTLNVNDQKRKGIVENFSIRKNQILENNRKNAIESIKKEIASVNTLEWLWTIVVWEYWQEVDIIQAINDRKARIQFEIDQENLRIEKEKIEKDRLEREKLDKEKREKEELEEKERLEKDRIEKEKLDNEKRQILKDKIEIAVWKIWLFLTVEALDSFYNELQEEVKNADIVKSDYNSKRKSLLQALEIEKQSNTEKSKEEVDETQTIENCKKQEKSSVHYVLQRWFEVPSTELQLEACIEAIKRTYWVYENKTEFVTYLRDFILSYNEE